MKSKQLVKWVALALLLALMSAAVTTGTADEPQAEPSAISCGDSANCSMGTPAVQVVNHGVGPAIKGRSAASKTGIRGIGQPGVKGSSGGGHGVEGYSESSYGVYGEGSAGGVLGTGMVGVRGEAASLGAGVWGVGNIVSYGVVAYNEQNHALWATNGGGPGQAGIFDGDVDVNGTLSKSGGSFKIDHPLNPANQYLYHSFVESPDMMNVYNGNVVLDENGDAWVELPAYFEALNRDYRYQLTAIGAPGPNLYIAEEIAENRFKVAGGEPGAKVSWQVTGIRQDPWANANRIPVEEEKPAAEQGYYLHPELYGQPESLRFRPIPDLEY
jgi:hypothetical protein